MTDQQIDPKVYESIIFELVGRILKGDPNNVNSVKIRVRKFNFPEESVFLKVDAPPINRVWNIESMVAESDIR